MTIQPLPICLATGLLLAAGAHVSPLRGAEIDFNRDVRPILADKCFACHGPDAKQRQADLRLDLREDALRDLGDYAAVVPGKPDQSELIVRINSDGGVMPPPESNLTLSAEERETLHRWIAAGAPYARHWAFIKPSRPPLPEGDFGPHPIDAFVGRRLREAGLEFAPEASPERLVRRLSLDLNGLPPTIAEVDAFVADYAARGETAYEALVDRLLASPRYGETMALPWLEAARFADTDGYQYDGPRHQYRWRDWVIEAYNRKLPFDQFTIEQLAGDLLPDATLDQQIATGFNRNHRYNSEAGIVVEEFLLENAVDRVDTTATLWMGVTMGCARCHDHKYDPFSQRDYYQLIAFFNSVPEAGRAIKAGNSEPVIRAPTAEQRRQLAARERELAAAAAQLRPTNSPDRTAPLIDRRLEHHYPLDRPAETPSPAASQQNDKLENDKGRKRGKARAAKQGEQPSDPAMVLRGEPQFVDGALLLDGASSVHLRRQSKRLTLRANTKFTFAFWLRPDSLDDCVVLSRQNPGTTRPGVEVSLVDGGRVRFDLITRWLAGAGRVTTREPLPKGQWTHVTISNDGTQSARGQAVYFDGAPVEVDVAYNTNSNVGGVDASRPLVVGAGLRPGSEKLRGAVRDLRAYSTNLWPEEVAVLAAPAGSQTRDTFARTKGGAEYQRYVELREALDRYRQSLPTVMVMRELDERKPTHIRKRGEYNSLGELVRRAVPEQLPPLDPSWPRNRLGLARWLTSPDHPLTARVAVNRHWQHHFGVGLVKTAEDFGVQGEPPSHPQLLDWLATEFIRSGWDVAGMHRLIVTSRVYRQESRVTPRKLEADPDNRLLSRGPRLRLSGHAIRDQALLVSGLLAEKLGGPSVSPYQPANLWAEMSMGMRYKQSSGEDLYRRSLYTIWKRTVAPPTMAVFDAADRESCWVKRKETNTPLQALTLLNEVGFVECARRLACRMLSEGAEDPIGFGFRTVLARRPTEQERAVLERSLEKYRREFRQNEADAEALISTGASPTNTDFPAAEIAAHTALANVLLNLDEAITRE